jgi:DHA1 family tetracycline resistance protein-like MFS transporter
MLFLARVVDGISGANISTAQAAITDSTTEKTRTQGLGLLGAAFGLGFVIGPVIAFISLALSGNDYRAPAFVAAGFSALSILLTWFWFEETLAESEPGERGAKAKFSLSAMFRALRNPAVGVLLALIFFQQIAFGSFEQLLALFTLNRLGLNASGNAVIFVFVGMLVVAVQGYFIGKWSRSLGDRRLIYLGLAALAVGLSLVAVTPRQPVPWYSRDALRQELSTSGNFPLQGDPTPHNLSISIPSEENKSWLGLGWILVAMVPTAIGGGILQPSLNSLITKRIHKDEVGGMLGISSAFLSGANAIAPLIGGAIFQAMGSTWPFLFSGVLMAMLWLAAMHLIKPGREELASPGLAHSVEEH